MIRVAGCICRVRDPDWWKGPGGSHNIAADCPYHLAAAAAPDDHSIPWNCPTYWDGCNCPTEDPAPSQEEK